MEQEPLFFENVYEAYEYVARRIGKKELAEKLFPHKSIRAAQGYLSDTLNPNRDEKLDPEQTQVILRWGRRIGCHAAINFICADAHYAHPEPKDPEHQASELERQIASGIREQNVLLNRYLALKGGGRP